VSAAAYTHDDLVYGIIIMEKARGSLHDFVYRGVYALSSTSFDYPAAAVELTDLLFLRKCAPPSLSLEVGRRAFNHVQRLEFPETKRDARAGV
jgi:hypothetical protein